MCSLALNILLICTDFCVILVLKEFFTTYLKTGRDAELTKAPHQSRRRKRDVSSSLDEDEDENHFFSEDDYEYHELYYDFHYGPSRSKREVSDDAIIKPFPVNGITEADARKQCEKLLLHSAAAKACGGLDIPVKDNMGDCMLDIQVGNFRKGLVRE